MIKTIQQEIHTWSVKNFGRRVTLKFNPIQILQTSIMVGKMAHSVLKTSQGIRGKKEDLKLIYEGAKHGANAILSVQGESLGKINMDTDISSLLGVIEEVGELAYGCATNNPREIIDAIGDIQVYLFDFAARNGYDAEDILLKTWAKVKERDWKANNKTGEVNGDTGSNN